VDSNTYSIDITWPSLMTSIGIRTANVLRRAGLPDDLFARSAVWLDEPAYFRFWEALEAEAADGAFVVRLFAAVRGESFSPPLFAALCSPNLLTALQRLATYKPLIAPIRLDVHETRDTVTVRLTWTDKTAAPPRAFVAAELLFSVCLARLGTHETIRPTRVVTSSIPLPTGAFEEYLGVAIHHGNEHSVSFSRHDALKPFLSSNAAMWAIFEPALRERLAELRTIATTAERVRAALLEALPAGLAGIDDISVRLGLSRRTLQRRLDDEGTSFKDILRATREALAFHYLQRTSIPSAEISFLLGFEEPNSFFRAFNEWTGRTPEAVRRAAAASF